MIPRLICALTRHRPQYDKRWSDDTHYPFPCRCGRFLSEHSPEECDCAEKFNAETKRLLGAREREV